MASKAFLVLALLFASSVLFSSEAVARELSEETSTMDHTKKGEEAKGVEDAKYGEYYGGYPGGGYGGYPRGGYGGYPGGGYPRGGYGGYPRGGYGGYPRVGGGYGGYPGGGYGGYPRGGYGGYPGYGGHP